MAQSVNTVAIVGNLTRDPELRTTPSGTSVTTLRVAVSDRVKRGDEWQDATYFFDVTVWARQAEACAQYLSKGRPVGVQGKLTWREWEAQDGGKRQSVEILAHHVQFLGGRDDGPRERPPSPANDADYQGPTTEPDFVPAAGAGPDDDIPF